MTGDGATQGRFIVTQADDASAVLQDVESSQIHTLADNPGFERHEVIEATLVTEPPMEVVWRVSEIDDRWSITVEQSPETPTAQARDLAGEEAGDLVRRERAGEGEIHVISVPPEQTDEAAADVVEDDATLTRAARLGVNRVAVRAADGVVSVRYLP
jgi:hypothetical protein